MSVGSGDCGGYGGRGGGIGACWKSTSNVDSDVMVFDPF